MKPTYRYLLSLAVIAVVTALFLSRREPRSAATPVASVPVEETPGRRHERAAVRARPWLPLPEAPSPGGHAVIERVEVSRSEVCRGEEFMVNVASRSKDDGDNYLSFEVLDRPDLVGPRFPMRLDESLAPGQLKVYAQGKYGDSSVADMPAVHVKDCDAPATLTLDLVRSVDAMDRVSLTAQIVAPTTSKDGLGFKPARYTWDFGDGTQAATAEPVTRHSYESRTHETAYSYFLVRVTATDASGQSVTGSRTIRFVNLGFGPLKFQDRVMILSGFERQASGREQIWLYHGAPEDVDIVRVTVKDVATDERGEERMTERSYDPTVLLGISRLPSRESIVIADLEELEREAQGHERSIEIAGRTRGGSEAIGSFTLVAAPRDSAATGRAL